MHTGRTPLYPLDFSPCAPVSEHPWPAGFEQENTSKADARLPYLCRRDDPSNAGIPPAFFLSQAAISNHQSKDYRPLPFWFAADVIAKGQGKASEKRHKAGPRGVTRDHLAVLLGVKRYRQTLD